MQFYNTLKQDQYYARSLDSKCNPVFCQHDVRKTCNHVISQIAFYTFRSIKTCGLCISLVFCLYKSIRNIVCGPHSTLHARRRKHVPTEVRTKQIKNLNKMKEFMYGTHRILFISITESRCAYQKCWAPIMSLTTFPHFIQ